MIAEIQLTEDAIIALGLIAMIGFIWRNALK